MQVFLYSLYGCIFLLSYNAADLKIESKLIA